MEFNLRLDSEIKACAGNIASNVADLVERILRHPSSGFDENITRSGSYLTTSGCDLSAPQDVRIADAIRNTQTTSPPCAAPCDGKTKDRVSFQQAKYDSHKSDIHEQLYQSSSTAPHPSTSPWVSYLRYNKNGKQHVFITDCGSPHHDASKQKYMGNDQLNQEQILDDPNTILARHDDDSWSDQIEEFLSAQDAPHYRNSSDSKLMRKQQAAKAIASAFQESQFGREIEEDWEQHRSEYQAISLDYHLRSKDLAYFFKTNTIS